MSHTRPITILPGLVVLVGPLGAGKRTFAAALARLDSVEVVASVDVAEALFGARRRLVALSRSAGEPATAVRFDVDLQTLRAPAPTVGTSASWTSST